MVECLPPFWWQGLPGEGLSWYVSCCWTCYSCTMALQWVWHLYHTGDGSLKNLVWSLFYLNGCFIGGQNHQNLKLSQFTLWEGTLEVHWKNFWEGSQIWGGHSGSRSIRSPTSFQTGAMLILSPFIVFRFISWAALGFRSGSQTYSGIRL